MIWKRVIRSWVTLLALVLASAGASASADVSPKTHVGVCDLVAAICIEASSLASAEEHRGNWDGATTETSDVPHAARGGGAAAKVCFVAGTLVATPDGAIPIEELRVGARVETLPGGVETAVNSSWRVLRVTLVDEHEPDHLFDVELLRPPEWFEAHHVAGPGDRFFLELEEMGVAGVGVVDSIHDTPEVEGGVGRVVLMTVNHLNSDVYELSFDGVEEKLRPTGAHPLYSLDRDAWVPVRDLLVSERLQTADGAVRIAALERIGGEHRVYNIEVEAEHEYLVSKYGIRAHNTCFPDAKTLAKSFNASKDAWHRVVTGARDRTQVDLPERP